MILVYDVETTGKNPRTARCVQLAALLVDPATLTVAETFNKIITPVGFDIPSEATAIHGISTERAWDEGLSLELALEEFAALVARARRSVGHNISYDNTVLLCEHQRLAADPTEFVGLAPFCTMLALTDRMKLPGRFGNFKWPRLDEAYRFCFNREFENAHTADADVLATFDIFKHGLSEKWWR